MQVIDKPIPFLDLSRQYQSIKGEVLEAVNQVFEQSAFSLTPFVDDFELRFASYCNRKFAIGVNSGTSALHLALLALNIGHGDEVIVPSNTFIATASAVSNTGATPVFADCMKGFWQIDPEEVHKKITGKTKAIIGVHLYGQPCRIDVLHQIARNKKLFLIEDCAQAHGAKYKDSKVGTWGDISCFSFYPGKNLGAYGEAGAITTDDEQYSIRLKKLRNLGSEKKYFHDEIGFNMRMEGVQAAVLNVKLKYLDSWNEKRRIIADFYRKNISPSSIEFQNVEHDSSSVYHLFVVAVPGRNEFIDYLKKYNVWPGIHYPVPCHLQKAYSFLDYKPGDLANSEYLSNHCVSLPIFPELSKKEMDYIVEVINNYKFI